MKIWAIVVLSATLVMCSLGVGLCSDPDAVYDLAGEWDAVITVLRLGSDTQTVENDVVKMSQKGNSFLGVRTIGGNFISKNEEWIKGRIANGIIEEVSIAVTDDPIAFTLEWNEARATVAADGKTIITQTYIAAFNNIMSATLTRK